MSAKDMKKSNGNKRKNIVYLTILMLGLVLLFLVSINLGTIQVTPIQLFKGLFVEYDQQVATIYDLRFPRTIVAIIAGAAIAVSGLLLQVVLKNPLADPGVIGISSGASLAVLLTTSIYPLLFSYSVIFGFIGGMLTFLLIYRLAWKKDNSVMRILLVGIAIQACLSGIISGLTTMSGNNVGGVASMIEGNISMKTWNDVEILSYTILPILLLSIMFSKKCDILGLEDKTIRGLGVEVDKVRLQISVIAVMLVSFATVIVGPISFLGLIIPHLGRIIVGAKHKVLLPFTMLLGGFVFLLADTIGRTIMPPYEISAAVIMSIIGGPVFICLLKRNGGFYGRK